jgi:hypothetical protein
MPFDISSQPRGLMALLGAKVGGTAPRLLGDQVVGTVDLLDFYTLNIRESLTAAGPAPAVGGNVFAATLIVPAGEAWIVHAFNVEAACGAGAAIDMAPGVALAGFGQIMTVGDYLAAAATQNVRTWSPIQFVAGPGAQFGFNVRSVTLVPTVTGFLTFSRVRI